ncbi:MAG: hypothetical protein V4598_17500 [Bdellovibrionota bacterium]
MSLQSLLTSHDVNLTEGQIRAFYLGTFVADKPVTFKTAMEEVLMEAEVEDYKVWEKDMKALHDQVKANVHKEMVNLIADEADLRTFLQTCLGRLDYFLTGYAVSGASDDEDTAEVVEELEDTVLDLEDYLADESSTKESGMELKKLTLETWKDITALKED